MRVLTVPVILLTLIPPHVHAAAPADSIVRALRDQARALTPLARTPLARSFLAATSALPTPSEKTVFFDPTAGLFYREAEIRSLPDSIRVRLQSRTYDGQYYYQTRYGSPLNYTRAIELVAQAGLTGLKGKRVLDFGYGRIAHLRLLASLGADVVGIDVDPILRALYADPGDQGMVPGFGGPDGSLHLVHGSFPADAEICAAVGDGYDLVLSKNTLKGGHGPGERAAQRRIINLGVSDSVFAREIYARLNPGGWFLMYTLSGPRGNGGCPFSENMLRATGFDVVAYDRDDSPLALAMRNAVNPDRGKSSTTPSEVVTGTYTLARKPGGPR